MNALRQARIELGWSQSRLIAELQRQARSLGKTLPPASSLKTQVSRWENGHKTPDAFHQRLFAMTYRRSPEELGIASDDAHTSLAFGETWEESVATASQLWRRDLDRRNFLKSSAFSAAAFAAPTLHALMGNADAFPTRTSGRLTVGTSQLTFIQDMTKQFGTLDNRYGGGQVRRAAVAFLDGEVSPLLTKGRFSSSVGRSLLRSAAELARLVGWMTHDVGRHGLAQRYLMHALRLAEVADPVRIAAAVRSVQRHFGGAECSCTRC